MYKFAKSKVFAKNAAIRDRAKPPCAE